MTFTFGILLVGLWMHRVIGRLGLGYLTVTAAGFLLYWITGAPVLSMAGLFDAGLGVSGLCPLILALVIGVAGDLTVQTSARAILASGTAILALPLVFGCLVNPDFVSDIDEEAPYIPE